LSYVIQRSSLIFPLIGPRTINELDSSIFASTVNLNADEIKRLSIE
jgi:aryl-alcohol dehydrogenase-like predicted oxidoreductase